MEPLRNECDQATPMTDDVRGRPLTSNRARLLTAATCNMHWQNPGFLLTSWQTDPPTRAVRNAPPAARGRGPASLHGTCTHLHPMLPACALLPPSTCMQARCPLRRPAQSIRICTAHKGVEWVTVWRGSGWGARGRVGGLAISASVEQPAPAARRGRGAGPRPQAARRGCVDGCLVQAKGVKTRPARAAGRRQPAAARVLAAIKFGPSGASLSAAGPRRR